jgi:histidine triad (HIT) family protein
VDSFKKSKSCIFCRIVSGEASANKIRETSEGVFFYDISPKAPVHVIAVPRKHLESLQSLGPSDEVMVGRILGELARLARELMVDQDGYRVITNVGRNSGQEVLHLHWHLLAGEKLGPLRC